MKSWRFAFLFLLLLSGGLVVNAWEYLGEARVERKELRGFPKQVGPWQQTGGDEQLDDKTLAVLRASDYPCAIIAPLRACDELLCGYYASRERWTYHSPLNCSRIGPG